MRKLTEDEQESWQAFSHEASDALGVDRSEFLKIEPLDFIRRWGAIRSATLSGVLLPDEATAALFPRGDETPCTLSEDDLYRDCLQQAAQALGFELEHLGTMPHDALVRRWLALRDPVLSGAISPAEGCLMLYPEIGEAWARAVFADAGMIDPSPEVLGHMIGAVSADLARQVREWLARPIAPLDATGSLFVAREAKA